MEENPTNQDKTIESTPHSALFSSAWWKFANCFVLTARAHTMKPAIMLSVGFILPYIVLDVAMKLLRSKTSYNGLGDVLAVIGPAILLFLFGSLGALALVLVSLGIFLVVLTGLCRGFLDLRNSDSLAINVAHIRQSQVDAVKHFYARKSYLVTVWFMYTLLLCVPAVVWLVCSGILVLPFLPPPFVHIDIPANIYIPAAIVLGITSVGMTNYALALMPLSAVSRLGGTKVAVEGLLLSLRVLPSLTISGLVSMVVCSIADYSIDLLVKAVPALVNSDLPRYFMYFLKALSTWFLMFYLVPFSVVIPCELLKTRLTREGMDA